MKNDDNAQSNDKKMNAKKYFTQQRIFMNDGLI